MNEARTVLDPTDERETAERRRVPRLPSIAGKKLALLDISKARGDVFLERLAENLRGLGAEVESYKKPTFSRPAPLDLRQQIAERADAVIEALAD